MLISDTKPQVQALKNIFKRKLQVKSMTSQYLDKVI